LNEIETVRAWHDALNIGIIDQVVELCTHDIEVGGPRGSGTGHQLLREWFDRAGISLSFGKAFHRESAVVVEQTAVWPGSEPSVVASAFWLRDGLISRILRYEGLDSALVAAGLDRTDAVEA
jgi:hypothetical protein